MTGARDDVFWRRIEASGWPSHEELAKTERELAATESDDLPPSMIERIVGDAIRDFGADIGVASLAGRPGAMKVLVGAAAALCCMLSLSWIGARILWPTAAPISRQFAAGDHRAVAILLTPEAQRVDEGARAKWTSAFSVVYRDTKGAILSLTKLRDDGATEVANAADRALAELQLASCAAETLTEDDLVRATALANDVDAPAASRRYAIARLAQFAAVGVAAINETQATLPDNSEFKRRFVRKLELLLAAVPPIAPQQPDPSRPPPIPPDR